MKIIYFFLSLLIVSNTACAHLNKDTLFVAHWNVENLFDTVDDPKTADEEFLPAGVKEWTDERLDKKMYNLARVIRSMNDDNGPDLLGVCEVEHQELLDTMIAKYLSDKHYRTAYLESPDGRGIDNGIIYNSQILTLLNLYGDTVNIGGGGNTRLILHAEFVYGKIDTVHFFVNHWPSRRGGEDESEPRRISAAKVLKNKVDLLRSKNPDSKIIIVGDFNDEPLNLSLLEHLKASPFFCDSINTENLPENSETYLFNLSYKAYNDGLGSYFYQSDFNMIDQIIVSKKLILGNSLIYVCDSYEVYKPEIMVTRTGKFQGAPFPTFGGSRYLGGYSDHFVVTAKFFVNRNE